MGPIQLKEVLTNTFPADKYRAFLALSALEQGKMLGWIDLDFEPKVMNRLLDVLVIFKPISAETLPEGEAVEETTELATENAEVEALREQLINEMQLHFLKWLLANEPRFLSQPEAIRCKYSDMGVGVLDKLFGMGFLFFKEYSLEILAKEFSLEQWVISYNSIGHSLISEIMAKFGVYKKLNAEEREKFYNSCDMIASPFASSPSSQAFHIFANTAHHPFEFYIDAAESTIDRIKNNEANRDSPLLRKIITEHPSLAGKVAKEPKVLSKITKDDLDILIKLHPTIGIAVFNNKDILNKFPETHKRIATLPRNMIADFLDSDDPNLTEFKSWAMARLLQLGVKFD